jgi:hypothetical protein
MSVTLEQCRARADVGNERLRSGASSAACDELVQEHCTKPENRYADECACYWAPSTGALSNLNHCFADACKKPGVLKLGAMVRTECPNAIDCVQKVFIYGSGAKAALVGNVSASQVCAETQALEEREKARAKALADAQCSTGKSSCESAVAERLRACSLATATGAAESAYCIALRTQPPLCLPCGNPNIAELLKDPNAPTDPDKPKDPKPTERPDVWDYAVPIAALALSLLPALAGSLIGFLLVFFLIGPALVAAYFALRPLPKKKDEKPPGT